MVFWLISWWNILLSEIWRNLNEKICIWQTVKRLSSNLSKFSLENLSEIKDNLLIQNKNCINSETVISLDWWDINKSWASKMQNLKKIHDGSKWTLELWYCLNSIVAKNIDNKWKPKNISLNLNLYSTKEDEFTSENHESIKSVDDVTKIIWDVWIWVLASMNFSTILRKNDDKYFTSTLIWKAKALNHRVLKKIDKLNLWNLCLFEKLANPYEILGKL